MSTVKVLEDRLLILPDEAAEKTESGIYLPETGREKPFKGTVVHAGKVTIAGAQQIPAGSKVIYSKYAGVAVEIDRKEHLIIGRQDVLALICE